MAPNGFEDQSPTRCGHSIELENIPLSCNLKVCETVSLCLRIPVRRESCTGVEIAFKSRTYGKAFPGKIHTVRTAALAKHFASTAAAAALSRH